MSTITTLNSSDTGPVSRGVINTNFTNLNTDKAELASPTFTGTPTLPTGTVAVTQTAGDNSTKVATTAFVAGLNTIETTTGVTHSLTTTAGQRVMVWAKGWVDDGTGVERTVALKYNTVTKDTVVVQGGGSATNPAFSLMYTETPGAATANITVETTGGSLANVVIMVLKL